jgi:hypothetical protein
MTSLWRIFSPLGDKEMKAVIVRVVDIEDHWIVAEEEICRTPFGLGHIPRCRPAFIGCESVSLTAYELRIRICKLK